MRNGSRSSLCRALSLLDAFGPSDVELTLGELAGRAAMPKSTTHRMVCDLVEWGGLERTPTGLRLGLRLFELGHLVPTQRALREIALPYLEDLYEITHKTVNLAVRDGHDVVYVEKLVSRTARVPHSRTGGRLPLYCTALGKALLAFSPQEVVEDVVARGLRPVTPHTITDPGRLRRDLATVRHSRVAFDREESRVGMHCTAAPVFNTRGRVVAALSVTGMEAHTLAREISPAVLTAALSLSRQITE